MKKYEIKVYPSKVALPKKEQLAYRLAELACGEAPLNKAAGEMAKNRILDNAAVAAAALNRRPVTVAREMALARKTSKGATLFGVSANHALVHPEWAAWANGVAVRELDFHDTFLAADYAHPGDSIPALIAIAQYAKLPNIQGLSLLKGILTAYEIHIALVKSICLHKHAIDHILHVTPSIVAGLAAMLSLPVDITYQAIGQALHVSLATRQSRKGEISSWKAYAPAHAGKLAIECLDRAMRGESSPSPIYEGEDSVIASVLDGPLGKYTIELPEAGEAHVAILESYTKEYSAEYQSQALIDLAFELRKQISNLEDIESLCIHTSHHTHKVIGTGSNDPQKFDPKASRETLDHSIMYIVAVALEDGYWHHIHSYTKERANRSSTLSLWQKISTLEDPKWTALYHESEYKKKAFGGKFELRFKDGSVKFFEKKIADAHPYGARPFGTKAYINKFKVLTEDIVEAAEKDRFIETSLSLEKLTKEQLLGLHFVVPQEKLLALNTRGLL